ncbi:MAG: hypothetical protein ACHQDC_03250 [Acidimicrobiales bacterium]
MADQYVVLGLAHTRSRWFGEVARWSTTGAAPLEFVKCMKPDEVRAIVGSGRRVSALLVDGSLTHFDRDLVAAVSEAGAVTIVVDERASGNDWDATGCAAVLDAGFDRAALIEVLSRFARVVDRNDRRATSATVSAGVGTGRLIAVTGAGGTGASTLAIALAQGLAASDDPLGAIGGCVALADGARRADLAMYHDVGDVIPGLLELIELHRADRPDPLDVRRILFPIARRRYDLLLGMRRSRDWPAMRPRAVAAAIDGLRRSYDVVVVDVEPDVEGEAQTGSLDVEDRHAVARAAVLAADLVLVVGKPGLKGVHDIVRIIDELCECGTPVERIVPVVNHAPRHPAQRSEMVRTLRSLTVERRPSPRARPSSDRNRISLPGATPIGADRSDDATAPPVFIRSVRMLEDIHRSAGPLPDAIVSPLVGAVTALLARLDRVAAVVESPSPVRPGELGVAVASTGAA